MLGFHAEQPGSLDGQLTAAIVLRLLLQANVLILSASRQKLQILLNFYCCLDGDSGTKTRKIKSSISVVGRFRLRLCCLIHQRATETIIARKSWTELRDGQNPAPQRKQILTELDFYSFETGDGRRTSGTELRRKSSMEIGRAHV